MVGSIAVSATDYPVNITAFLQFVTPALTSGYSWWAFLTVEIGATMFTPKESIAHGAQSVGTTLKSTHGISLTPGPGTATVKLWIGSNGIIAPTSIHADSTFTGAFTKK